MRTNTLLLCFTISQLLAISCWQQAVPDECLRFAPSFSQLIYSMAKSDTISFINLNGELRVFVVKKFDSVLVNSSGPFSPIPYKDISFEYDELPKSLTSLKRNNEVFISKSGCSNKTAISIKFENMWFYDSILPPPYRKSITLGKISFEPTYVLENPASLPYNNDVRALYLSVIYGIQGFETGKGEKWISCRLLPRCP